MSLCLEKEAAESILQRKKSTALSLRRRALFTLITAVMISAVFEFAAAVLIMIRPDVFDGYATSPGARNTNLAASIERMLENRPDSHAEFHPELGWRTRPGVDNGSDIINMQSLRSRRQYARHPSPDALRIAAFGDSFVYGCEVHTDEAWPSLIEQSRPNTEVLNYGVPGYGQDQIYLRFLAEARDLHPRVVLFGVATPTLTRIVSVSRAFRLPRSPVYFLSKPRFLLDGEGALSLVPNHFRELTDLQRYLEDPHAIRELGELDYWYEPLLYESWLFDHSFSCRLLFSGWTQVKRRFLDSDRPLIGPRGQGVFNESSSGFDILKAIIERFDDTARDFGMQPVVLILPNGYSVERMRRGQPGVMDPVRDYLRRGGLDFIDLKDAFLAQPVEVETESWFHGLGGHYSPQGNRVVADWIHREIDRRGW